MASKDLTDAELRQKLKSLGQKVGPITASTRKLYVKRLEKLKNIKSDSVGSGIAVGHGVNGNHSGSDSQMKQSKVAPRRKTFGFSSDESDNNDENKKRNKTSQSTRTRSRASTGGKLEGTSLKSKPLHQRVGGLAEPRRSTRGVKVTTSASPITNGYSDDSDDSEASENGSWVQVAAVDTSTSPIGSNSPRTALNPRVSQHNRSVLRSGISGQSSNTPNRFSLRESLGECTGKSEMDDSSSFQQTYANSPKNTHTVFEFRETRNGGDIFRRRALSQAMKQNENSDLIPSVSTDTAVCSNDKETPKEDSDAASLPKPGILSRLFSVFKGRPKVESNAFSHSETPSTRSWSLHCSVLLPICTIVFFIILGLLYVTMRTDGNNASSTLIGSSSTHTQDDTLDYVNEIYGVLATAAGNSVCSNNNQTTKLVSVKHLMNICKLDMSNFLKALSLISEHPEWEMLMYTDGEDQLLGEGDSLTHVQYMETLRPMLPALCRFKRAVEKVLFRVGVVLSVGLSIWVLILYRQYRVRKKEEEKQMMYTMVDKILDVLKNHHESSRNSDTIEPFIPILHVRDMIIQPQDRKKMLKVWDKSVHFISASESRIRVETQRISGEDCRVWRWIQVTSPSKRQQAPCRIWQGEAFDTNRSINTPNISPTPCLKIRNMFDPDVEKDADWQIQVQDSILEKCSDNNEIISVVVEKSSHEGLVYVKCATRAGAGKAFRSLHGSWFDGRLVTVKFIKLQRFHTRYPNSVDMKTPLKPSSAKPVSTFLPPTAAIPGFSTSTPIKSS